GDALPLAVDEFDGVAQATVAHHVVANRSTLAAVGAAVDGAVEIGLLADPDVVGYFGDDGAADGAMGAKILFKGDLDAGGGGLTGGGLAYGAAREQAET